MPQAGTAAASGAAASDAVARKTPPPVLPDYGGACLDAVVPALIERRALARSGALPAFLPEEVAGCRQVVLLVLDGLGFEQLSARALLAPALASFAGGPITSVAPTTTATALTSIVTGAPPSRHGIVGYRIATTAGVLNVLRWTAGGRDARTRVPPASLQHLPPFLGSRVPVVARAEFAGSGFTESHLHGAPLAGWRMPSSMLVEVHRLLSAGESLVYAYYDGVDKIAHETGLGEHYDAELRATDRLVADLADLLPPGAALVVTADHGQVEVKSDPIVLSPEIADDVVLLSGEGRFRWLHVRPGATPHVRAACAETYGTLAWVKTRDELIEEGWFGGPLAPEVASLLGDVALVPHAPVAFYDPTDSGELRLVARHGSLTAAEALVPLLAVWR